MTTRKVQSGQLDLTEVATALAASENVELTTNKGQPSGYAELDGSGKVPQAQLPGIALTDSFIVASQAAMLALSTAETGDVAIRTDINKSFILSGTYSTLADWKELLTPTDTVLSVNGNVGAVTLTKSDVGLSNVDNTSDASKPVSTDQATAIGLKQNTLVSGTNIKTIGGASILGSGDVGVELTLAKDVTLTTYSAVSENLLINETIAANTLATLGIVMARMQGTIANASGSTKSFIIRVRYGSTIMYQDTTANVANGDTCGFNFNLFLTPAGSTSAQRVSGVFNLGIGTAPTVGLAGTLSAGPFISSAVFAGTSAEDSTTALALQVSVEPSGSGTTISRFFYDVMKG